MVDANFQQVHIQVRVIPQQVAPAASCKNVEPISKSEAALRLASHAPTTSASGYEPQFSGGSCAVSSRIPRAVSNSTPG